MNTNINISININNNISIRISISINIILILIILQLILVVLLKLLLSLRCALLFCPGIVMALGILTEVRCAKVTPPRGFRLARPDIEKQYTCLDTSESFDGIYPKNM